MLSINKKPSEAPSTEGTQKVFYAAILGRSGAPQTYTSFRSLSTIFIEKQFTKCVHSLASSAFISIFVAYINTKPSTPLSSSFRFPKFLTRSDRKTSGIFSPHRLLLHRRHGRNCRFLLSENSITDKPAQHGKNRVENQRIDKRAENTADLSAFFHCLL